jgi:hypothetical protein
MESEADITLLLLRMPEYGTGIDVEKRCENGNFVLCNRKLW